MDQIVPCWKDKDDKEDSCSTKPVQNTTTFTRHIYFIRHGDYIKTNDDETQELTEIGQKQAQATGHRLQQQLQKPLFIYSSDLTRARQTAEIFVKNIMEQDPIPINYNEVFQEVGFKKYRYPCIPIDSHQFTIGLYKFINAINCTLSTF